MERKLASIQKIIDIRPIPKADAIECVDVLGWHLVSQKGTFKPGDLCVYFEVDALLPVKPIYEFLRKGCYNQRLDGFRIKTMTMRGQISQGLALPLDDAMKAELDLIAYQEGADVTENLGVRKYEAPIPVDLDGEVEGGIPSHIPKTDETRIESIPQILTRYQNVPFYVTEKMDGTSSTFYVMDGKFGVCGRNWCFVRDERNAFWRLANEMGIEEKLRSVGYNIAVQGEVCGPGIAKNPYNLDRHHLFLYNIFEIDKYRYLPLQEFKDVAAALGFETVPIVEENYLLPATVDEIKKYASAPSFFNAGSKREGIVVRPVVETNDVEIGRLSFKVISPQYLLDTEKDQE